MLHRLWQQLKYGDVKTSQECFKTVEGYTHGWGTTVGNGVEGWAPGAFFIHTDGAEGTMSYRNVGTKTTAVWVETSLLRDDVGLILGTGSDVTLSYNGTFLAGGPTSKMWGNAPSRASADYETLVHEYFNDFLVNADFDATNEWTVTEDDAACTQALGVDAVLGTLILTCKATSDDNGHQVQLNQESYKMAAGKKLWFETRIKSNAATQIDWYAGMAVTEDLTGVADNMAANGILFHKDDGATTIKLASSDNGTNLQNAAVGVDAAAFIKLGFYFDGAATGSATITPYINGVAGTAISSITYATVAEMSPIFGVRNGDATTQQTLTADYVKVCRLR